MIKPVVINHDNKLDIKLELLETSLETITGVLVLYLILIEARVQILSEKVLRLTRQWLGDYTNHHKNIVSKLIVLIVYTIQFIKVH
jgi:hypothetical protein